LATLEVIPECGHVVNVERPNDFNPLAVNYLLASAEMNAAQETTVSAAE
jgi:pimeloyl-ACP methyl ester carboxylesterase